MGMNQYGLLSGRLSALIAVAQVPGILAGFPVSAGDYAVPMPVSWTGVVVLAALVFRAFRLRRNASSAV